MSMWSRAYTTPRAVQRAFTGIAGAWDSLSGTTIPGRSGTGKQGTVNVTDAKAMTHSAYWACLRIRADLVSTFPCDVFRDIEGVAVELPKPPVLVDPGGLKWDFVDWMWASNRDLDSVGNVLGIIRERNGIRTRYYPDGLPSVIELQDPRGCSVVRWKGDTMYRIDGKLYNEGQIYHERQYPLSGSPVGLSPLLMASATVGEYLSMQQYGLDWFTGGGIPKAWMQNTRKRLQDPEREAAKQWYDETVRHGDLMVTGNDWEYNMIQAEQAGMEWLEGRRYGIGEVCRFLSVPPEMIHGAVSGQSITYANVTQANLQFLIMNLGPMVVRREKSLSKLLPESRYVKLNVDALLRMDPKTRQEVMRSQLETWQLKHSEARKLDNRAPFTAADTKEMEDLYTKPMIAGKGETPAPVAGGNEGATPAPVPAELAWTQADYRAATEFANRMESLAAAS